LAIFILVRTVMNTANRMLYPFLPIFARGLGVELGAIARLLSVRSLFGALWAPLVAPLAERLGRRWSMLLGLGLFSLGSGVVALSPTWPGFIAAVLLTHLGNMVFLPAMQAYLGERVPFERRGTVIALTELSWSLGFIVGVPLLGLLIARLGWSAAFPVLGLGALLCLLGLGRLMPRDTPPAVSATALSLWSSLRAVLTAPSALAALGVSLLLSAANECVNLVFGAWIEDRFALRIAALGASAFILGLAELAGEGGTALWADRLGKKRVVRAGIILTALASLLLPLLGTSSVGATAGLVLFYLGFEFAIVSYIPLMTEVLPESRAALMAFNLAAISLGRAAGALAAGGLYPLGFHANAIGAAVINILALILLAWVRVREG
jgi:predicted MFS family arabinose efflux permease